MTLPSVNQKGIKSVQPEETNFLCKQGKCISATHKLLGAAVKTFYNTPDPTFWRKCAARIIVLSVPVFQVYDAIANFAYPVGKLCLYKITKKDRFYMDADARSCHYAYARASLLGIIVLLPFVFLDPKLLITSGIHHANQLQAEAAPSDQLEVQCVQAPLAANLAILQDPEFALDHQALANAELKEKSSEELDNNWNLLKYFGHIRIINMDKDKEKLANCQKNLKSIGVQYEPGMRFAGILGKNLPKSFWQRMDSNYRFRIPIIQQKALDNQHAGETGCFLSHYNVLKAAKLNFDQAVANYYALKGKLEEAKAQKKPTEALKKEVEQAKREVKKFSSVLILEDDNRFGKLVDKKKGLYTMEGVGRVFREAMSQLPHDYDMVYLMALDLNHRTGTYDPVLPKQRIKPLLLGYDLNAYVVHARFYDTILSHLEKRLFDDPFSSLHAVDVELGKLMPGNRVYRATPDLALQGGFPSDIKDKNGKPVPIVQRNYKEWHTIDRETDAALKTAKTKKNATDSALATSVIPLKTGRVARGVKVMNGGQNTPLKRPSRAAPS